MHGHRKGVPSVTDATVHLSYSKRSTVKVKFSLHLIKRNALNKCGTVKVKLHAFLTLALN